MDYTSIQQTGNDITIAGIKHFDFTTLDCGQAFRWEKTDEFNFMGIAYNRRIDLTQTDGNLILRNTTVQEFENIWKSYFDLERSYTELHSIFQQHECIKKALAYSPGLRLMRQCTWETLVSFILSQNSNIPRIKKMIELLCQNFGEELPCGGYTFPTPAALIDADLSVIRSGYRAPYIQDAARRTANGEFDLPATATTDELRRALLQVHGVGPKVADCVLLFGYGKLECFPMDVWMKRVMEKLYPHGLPPELQKNAGIAQQFLFHYARSNASEFL